MTIAKTNPKYRPDIDGLRAIAVGSVILFHAFPSRLNGGFTGVDIFFVISGFLITSIIESGLENEKFRIVDFYSKRIKRIFPSLSLVLFCCLILGWFNLLPIDFSQLGKHIAAGAGFSSNIVLWQEVGYFDHLSDAKPLLHLWSLGIEEQFYLIWPVILMLAFQSRLRPIRISIVLGLLSFISGCFLIRHHPVAAFYSPTSRFWEFCIGSSFALLKSRAKIDSLPFFNGKINHVTSVVGSILILGSIFLIKTNNLFPGFLALFPTVGAVLIIASGKNGVINRYLLSNRILVFIGLISYPLYLWHWVFLSFLNINSFLFTSKAMIVARVGSIFLSILFSYICYRWLERPVRSTVGLRISWILVILMITIGSLGYAVHIHEGLPLRYPEEIQKIAAPIDFKFEELARFGKCHFDSRFEPNNAQPASPECTDNIKPLILLWGDSYAAALYPGLKSLQAKNNFGILQATSCGTPPLLNVTNDNSCVTAEVMNRWNSKVIDAIRDKKPEIIIIHCFWPAHGDSETLIKRITEVNKKIKSVSPSSKIIMIGTPPTWGSWEEGLPKLLYRYWRSSPNHELMPEYMSYGLEKDFDDDFFRVEIPKLGIIYISAYEVLCRPGLGCLTNVGAKPTDILAIDRGHFSAAGSKYFLNKISERLLGVLQPLK